MLVGSNQSWTYRISQQQQYDESLGSLYLVLVTLGQLYQGLMYNTRFKGSFKAVPICVYKPRSIRKRTLGSISCNTTTYRPLRPIPSQLSAFGVSPGLRLVTKLQLLIGVHLTLSTHPLTRIKRNNREQSGLDYTIIKPTWLNVIKRPPFLLFTLLYFFDSFLVM